MAANRKRYLLDDGHDELEIPQVHILEEQGEQADF